MFLVSIKVIIIKSKVSSHSIDLYDTIYISQINKKKHLVKFNGPFLKKFK